MLERCHRIERFIAPGKDPFLKSDEIQDAVVRNIEVIGEAAKRVSPESREHLPQLDWKRICGMRDVLIHDYIGTSPLPGYPSCRMRWRSSSHRGLHEVRFPDYLTLPWKPSAIMEIM